MDVNSYKEFLELHKSHLKQIFYPLKQFLNKKVNHNKISYAFFPKHDILLKYSNKTAKISNFNNIFSFSINYKDIKEIKIYTSKDKYKDFWTCGKYFTQFYFKNYLNKRIGIKSEESYESIDLDNVNNLQNDKYYILPDKQFDFEKVINNMKSLDWNNPPTELNFIIKKGKYSNKYDTQTINFEEENLKTFFYNAHIGITISIIETLFYCSYNKNRIFYFDCNHIFNSNIKERKKYFLYFLNLLFLTNESKQANDFVMNVYYNFNYYNDKFEKLLEKIITNFSKSNKIFIIFDNIYNMEHYDMVEKIRKVIKVSENNHIFIRLFIQINKNTLDIIKDFFKTKSSVKTVGNCENKKLTDDLEIVKGSTENLKNFLINYRDKIDLKLREKFNIYSLNKYTNLIKLFYYLYIEDIDKELSEEIILSDILKDFIEFLYINIYEGCIEIKFRNKIIENFFQNYYIYYYNIFSKEQSKTFVKEILASEKGYNFERHIIFSVILGNLTNSYNRINIERIYCVGKFPKININKNILFYQTNSNAPFYDFSVLLKDKDDNYILKTFQAFINKTEEEIKKIDCDKIKYDLSYYIEKVNRALNIKIKGFTLGIILSKNRFDKKKEDKSVKNIKNFCLKNNYEFILYDIDENKFFVDESRIKDQYDIKEIKSLEEIKTNYFKPIKIFKDGCKVYQKFYIEKIEKSLYQNHLKKIFKFFDGNINFKLVGKFKCDISVLEQNKNKNIIFYYSWNDKNNINIYYNNYELYNESKKVSKNTKVNKKKEILIFMNENSENLHINGKFKFVKKNFIINKEDQETNNNYLIFNQEEDELYSISEDEDEDEEENIEEIIDHTEIKTDSIDKQNFESVQIEYNYEFRKDFNEYNYVLFKEKEESNDKINNSVNITEENNSDNSKIENENFNNISEDNNSKESIESNDESVDYDSKDLLAYPISEAIFNELRDGNQETYNNVKNKLLNENLIGENNFLKRKREKSG